MNPAGFFVAAVLEVAALAMVVASAGAPGFVRASLSVQADSEGPFS